MPFSSSDAYYQYERSVLHQLRYMHEESVTDFLHEAPLFHATSHVL
jgi:hypothetical protein